ncbi:MAG: hypothetical protein IT336_12775 [Thermomicrobiales bacterium]|nr:hypothetical protein [Thermomicrobiales bacterium]
MDTRRFDAMTKGIAHRLSRRTALAAGGAGLVAAFGHGTASAQQATPVATGETDQNATFLFVQTYTSGSLRPNPNAGTPAAATPTPGDGADYLLTLEGHHGETIYFSDRPERVFGEAPTDQFLDGFNFTPNNPPNAALVAESAEGGDDVVVLELITPFYDEAAGTVTYGANILSDYQGEGLAFAAAQQDGDVPEAFGRASLFIDDCADEVWGCYPRTGADPNGAVGYVTIGRCWSWSCVCCAWDNCDSHTDPDSLCNQSGYDCGDQGCIACTTSPIAVATGEGGSCI